LAQAAQSDSDIDPTPLPVIGSFQTCEEKVSLTKWDGRRTFAAAAKLGRSAAAAAQAART